MARILLVAPQHNGEPNFRPGGQVTAATGLRDQLRQFGCEVDVVNVVPPNFTTASRTSKLLSSFGRLARAWKLLRGGGYDCAIFFTGSLFNLPERLLIAAFARIRGVKTALFFRNSSVLGVSPAGIRGRMLRHLLAVPHFVLVQGEIWRELFKKMGLPAHRVAVIPNWVPMDIAVSDTPKEVQPGEKIRFVFVGRLVGDKGVFELAEAVEELAKRFDFEIRMAGDGGALESLRKNAHGPMKFLGWQGREGVSRVLEDSHVFVFPSYAEGFSNAVLEAMAHGLCVIATDVGAIGESVKEGLNGFLVTTRSSSELAGAMTRYLENPRLVSEHSAESLRIVRERHDRAKNCRHIVELLCGADK